MPLSPGTTLGSYTVTAQIGAGGMGEVYQARDTKLNRDVALKVLPDDFAADPERLCRFQKNNLMPPPGDVSGIYSRRPRWHAQSALLQVETLD